MLDNHWGRNFRVAILITLSAGAAPNFAQTQYPNAPEQLGLPLGDMELHEDVNEQGLNLGTLPAYGVWQINNKTGGDLLLKLQGSPAAFGLEVPSGGVIRLFLQTGTYEVSVTCNEGGRTIVAPGADDDRLGPRNSFVTPVGTGFARLTKLSTQWVVTGRVLHWSTFRFVKPGQVEAKAGAATQSDVQSNIERISRGPHQDLPEPQVIRTASGQGTGWDVRNNTRYVLHIYLSGPTTQNIQIGPGESKGFDLPSGRYRIAADVPDRSVVPFYAERTLGTESRWQSDFYIGGR